jgi:hypothetical protein
VKTLVTNYTLSAAAKRITFTDYPLIKLDQILLITNVTKNTIIYSFADSTLGGTLSGNILILTYDTGSMSNTDRLQIFIEDYVTPSTEAGLTTLNRNISSTNPRLSSIDTKLTTLINQTDGIEGSIDEIESFLDGIRNNTSLVEYNATELTFYRTSTGPVSGINSGFFQIWSIEGTSYAGYDQYLQIYDYDFSLLLFTQSIKAGENFKFNFRHGGAGVIRVENGVIRNSLTPFTHTPGNNDLYLLVRGQEF